jgi:hypothetical protein
MSRVGRGGGGGECDHDGRGVFRTTERMAYLYSATDEDDEGHICSPCSVSNTM